MSALPGGLRFKPAGGRNAALSREPEAPHSRRPGKPSASPGALASTSRTPDKALNSCIPQGGSRLGTGRRVAGRDNETPKVTSAPPYRPPSGSWRSGCERASALDPHPGRAQKGCEPGQEEALGGSPALRAHCGPATMKSRGWVTTGCRPPLYPCLQSSRHTKLEKAGRPGDDPETSEESVTPAGDRRDRRGSGDT